MTEIILSPITRARMIERKLGRLGYCAKIVKTPKEVLVIANEKGKRWLFDNGAGTPIDAQLQVCTFDARDNIFVILNSRKLRDTIQQLEEWTSPLTKQQAEREYAEAMGRAEMREKARWLLERYAGVIKQVGFGDTGD